MIITARVLAHIDVILYLNILLGFIRMLVITVLLRDLTQELAFVVIFIGNFVTHFNGEKPLMLQIANNLPS
jgi:hypothetical protein